VAEFTSFIIGEELLTLTCAEELVAQGHSILGLITTNGSIRAWAEEHGLRCIDPSGDFFTALQEQSFDYLFSIVNYKVLPKDVLALPRKCAINFHDSLLPRYAGAYATSWAIMNRETTHGVTWHSMTSSIDRGDILKQQSVTIAGHETAHSLNLKCYEAGVTSFKELIRDLAQNEVVPLAQNLADRTYFPIDLRPAGGCILSWHRTALDIDALIRALDFGQTPNPMGQAKIAVRDQVVVVRQVQILENVSGSTPGTILSIADHSLSVATLDRDVAVAGLSDIDGKKLGVADFVERFNLREGDKIEEINPATSERLTSLVESVCKNESYWAHRLANLEPFSFPLGLTSVAADPLMAVEEIGVGIPNRFEVFQQEVFKHLSKTDVLLALFAVFLGRISDSRTFDLGLTVADDYRDPGFRNLFASQVPWRIALSESETLGQSIEAIGQQLAATRKRKTYVRDLRVRYPLIAEAQNDGEVFPVAVQLDGDSVAHENGTDLLLFIDEDARCTFRFNTALFDRDRIERMVGHFQTLMKAVVEDPAQSISTLPLMTIKEQRQVLVDWNATAANFPRDSTLQSLFEAQVEQTPDRTALVAGEERLTYRELNRRANQLAHHLRRMGVGPEVLVGVLLERSADMLVGLLGVLKAGGAYVPLDPAYPQDRISFMLKDATTKVLLTQQSLKSKLVSGQAQVVMMDRDWGKISQEIEENPEKKASADSLAYVIYTSGSTGKPKGVAIEHHSAATLIHWSKEHFSDKELEGVLASTSICFDLSIFEIFMTLSRGGKVILAANALEITTLAAANEVTLINTVPSAIDELVRAGGVPASVTTVCLAGEPLQNALVQRIYEMSHIEKVYNLYGPTEDTTYSTWELTEKGSNEAVTIGRPIANTQVYILDRQLQPVPVGIPGWLYLAGSGLARGYLNRPELTAERFIPSAFSSESGGRMYKTGDLARYLANGKIEFLGRGDHQVKIRGFRIELGEIESALNRHPTIKESVVIVSPDHKSLTAYVVAEEGKKIANDQIRSYLKESLPEYMLPAAFVVLDRLPLSPNGKIDRKALPAPDLMQANSEREYVPPRDSFEYQISKLWEEVLGREPIGIKDNFFELGGHSLMAVRLFARIGKTIGKQLPLATLFQAQTIEEFARILRQSGWQPPWSPLVAIQPNGTKPPLFCLHAAGGNVLFYRDLSRHLGPDQPFYGIQPIGLDGKRTRHTRVEDMAEYYIREIKTVQPEGPYYLGGASLGGLIAYEMARQLREQGQDVALLALFDAWGPGYPKFLPTHRVRTRVLTSYRRWEHHIGSLVMLGPGKRIPYIRHKVQKVNLKFRRWRKRIKKAAWTRLYEVVGAPLPQSLVATQDCLNEASKKYKPQSYAGKLTLFRASHQPPGSYPDPTLGWSQVIGDRLEIHEVPGYHAAIVSEPRVRTLIGPLRQCLTRAQSPNSSEHVHTAMPQLIPISNCSQSAVLFPPSLKVEHPRRLSQ